MGQFFTKTDFNQADYEAFASRLQSQLIQLKSEIELQKSATPISSKVTLGAELEVYLVDRKFAPLPINQALLDKLNNPLLQTELNQYNLEFNLLPVDAAGTPFHEMDTQLKTTLDSLASAMHEYEGQVVPIGILPTLSEQYLNKRFMTDLPRYHVLAKQLSSLKGSEFQININGEEQLVTSSNQVTLEGANTSFQFHLKTDVNQFKNLFNAAQLVTPLVTAIAANSPVLLGKKLWHETRVALFKQAIDSRCEQPLNWRQPARVTYGQGWVREGPWELFAENVSIFKPIIPLIGESPYSELCLHHGTVWNWNRAVFAPEPDSHFRIEFRSLPSGPTITDMLANAALLVGLTIAMSKQASDYIARLPFKYAEYNFYRSAQYGLNANLIWPELGQNELQEQPALSILEKLLPDAAQGLKEIGIDEEESSFYLEVIRQRIKNKQNGATWQLQKLQSYESKYDRDGALAAMLSDYAEGFRSGKPVAEWD